MRDLFIGLLLAGLILASVACSGAPAPTQTLATTAVPTPTHTPNPVAEVRVTLQEFYIESSFSAFTVGTPYRFRITNRGDLAHEFIIEDRDALDEPLGDGEREAKVEDDKLLPRTTLTFEWTFTAAGDFQIACHVPGHYSQGMVFPITVQ